MIEFIKEAVAVLVKRSLKAATRKAEVLKAKPMKMAQRTSKQINTLLARGQKSPELRSSPRYKALKENLITRKDRQVRSIGKRDEQLNKIIKEAKAKKETVSRVAKTTGLLGAGIATGALATQE